MRMRVLVTVDHPAAQLNPVVIMARHEVSTAKPAFGIVGDTLESSTCDGPLRCLGIAVGFLDSSGCVALRGHHTQLRQPTGVDGIGGVETVLGPGGQCV